MKKIVFIYLIFCIFLSSCEKKQEPITEENISQAEELPSQVITQFNLTETIDGQKKWELFARKAIIYDDKKIVFVDSVYIDFYKNLGELYSNLRADSGIVYQDKNDMEAIGNVVVTTSEGEKLETQRVRWDNRRNKILSDEFVKVTRGNDILTGVGFETDPNLQRVQVKKDVKAYVKDSAQEINH